MPTSYKAINKYAKANYDRIAVVVPKGSAEAIKAAAASENKSTNRYILEAIEAKCLKILRYKYIAGLHHYQPIELKGLSERLNSPHAAWLAAKLIEESITLLKNEQQTLPLKELDKKKT